MSMSISVLISDPLPTPAEVQQAVVDLGFDLRIDDLITSLDSLAGFRTMTFGQLEAPKPTGVEIYVEGVADFASSYGLDIDSRFNRVISFRWGSKMDECYAALTVCAALAKARDGEIFADYQASFAPLDDIVAEARSVSNLLKR